MAGGWDTRHAGMPSRGRAAHQRLAPWFLFGILLLVCALVALFSVRGVRIVNVQRGLDASLATEQELIGERSALEERWAQKDDLRVVEEEARRRLGWIVPGEVSVIFVAPRASSFSERE